MKERKPTDAEVQATTLGWANPTQFDGWYCPNHPIGESLANEHTATHCWGCGAEKTDGGVAPEPIIAMRL